MMKTCRVRCFADLHLHEWREGAALDADGVNTRLAGQVEAVRRLCQDDGRPEWAVVCGDLAHSRAGLTAPVLWALRRVLEAFDAGFRQTWIIPGNHDYPAKRGPAPLHALVWAEAAKGFPNVRVVSEPGRWSVPGSPEVFCLPWTGDADALKASAAELALDALARPSAGPRLLIAHVGLDGAAFNDSFFARGRPVKLADLRPEAYSFVALGDYHLRQQVGPNAWYIGSPMQHTRGEAGQAKGALDVDLANPHFEPILVPSGAPEFISLRLEGEKKEVRALQKRAEDAAKEGHFVRLVAPPGLERLQLKAAEKTGLPVEREPAPPAGPRVALPLSAGVPEIVEAYADSLRETADGDAFADEVVAGLSEIAAVVGPSREDRQSPWFKPLALSAENFLGYARLNVPNLAGLGAVFLDGENRDSTVQRSNGAGKSTLADAISFALFGRTLRDGVKVAEARRAGRERGSASSVELALALRDGRTARVRRGVGSGGLSLAVKDSGGEFRDGTPADRQQQAALVQAWLGMDFDLFRRLVVFGQSGGEAFASLADSGRKATLEALVSGGRFDAWLAVAKERRALAAQARDAAERRREVADARAQERASALEAAREEAAGWEDRKAADLRALGDEIARLADRLAVRERELAAFGPLRGSLAQREEAEREAAEALKAAGASLAALREVAALIADELAPLEWETRRRAARRRELSAMEAGDCATCGQPLTAAGLAAAIRAEDRAVAALASEAAPAKADLEAIRPEEAAAVGREAQAREALERARTLAAGVREKLRGEPLAQERLERAAQELAAGRERKRSLEALEYPVAGRIAAAETALEEARAETADAEAQADAASVALRRFGALADALGNQGARAFLLEQLAPRIQEKANEALAAMSGGALSVSLRVETAAAGQKTVLEVANSIGAPCYGGDSGGERRLVDLALAWAIHEAGSDGLGLRIVDEAFDALDPDAAARAGAFLASSVREGETLVVVSHNASVAERFAGPRWLAIKEGRVCRLETEQEHDENS